MAAGFAAMNSHECNIPGFNDNLKFNRDPGHPFARRIRHCRAGFLFSFGLPSPASGVG
jgi:hypothetical protein